MSMDRRSFLRRSTIALAGGLLVGDAAIDAFERLTHRKVFALGGLPQKPSYLSGLFRPGDGVGIVRNGALVEFGTVTNAHTVTFNSRVDVQAGDLMIRAEDSGHPSYYMTFPAHPVMQLRRERGALAWAKT